MNKLNSNKPEDCLEYWVKQASEGRNIAECWQAIDGIFDREHQTELKEIFKELEKGHGGGSFRRIISQLKDKYLKPPNQ